MPTLHCKLQHTKHVKCVKCNAFSPVDCGWLWKELFYFCGQVALKRTGCLQQMFKMMNLRLHACTQSCSPLINGLVDDALHNASPCIGDSLLQVTDVMNRHLLHTFLCFVQPLLGNASTNCCALYPFKSLSSTLKPCLHNVPMTL